MMIMRQFLYFSDSVLTFISGSTLWTCILQCLYNTVVCPAADLPSWSHGSDVSSPPACPSHHAQHAVQASDQLWQRWFWLYSHTTIGPAAVTPQGLWAQPQKACQLWGGMWVSEFHFSRFSNASVCWFLLNFSQPLKSGTDDHKF